MNKKIALYQDYVHNNASLFKSLKSYPQVKSIEFLDANDIMGGALTSDFDLFVMPGGASRYVAAKLDGVGNQAIKDYVAQGGLYMGICAGAYYACSRTEWLKGQEGEICVDNELAFFPGIAQGPILDFTDGDKMAKIVHITDAEGKTHPCFYWGGNQFLPSSQNFETLARYANGTPAVVAGVFGKGRYILSSPHLEIDSTQLELMRFDVSDNSYADIATMPNSCGLTTALFYAVLDQFLK